MSGLVLSLFPGIGLLDMAFEEEGFCVVRGPDMLWGGDVRRFHAPPRKFSGVIGGPPCQAFSTIRYLVHHNGYETKPTLIPEYERIVGEAHPDWFVMENVRAAPEPVVPGYAVHSFLLNNRWLGEEQNRVRRFSHGVPGAVAYDLRRHLELAALEAATIRPAVLASGGHYAGAHVKIGGSGKVKKRWGNGKRCTTGYLTQAIKDQGLPQDFLSEAPFTVQGKIRCVGNGVPLPMGRAIARAVKAALSSAPPKKRERGAAE